MRNPVGPKWMVGALFALPLLLGAQGRGCGAAVRGPAPADAAAACESQAGEHCGGNTAHPCTCGAGLVCTPGSSGLPFGDVGGTCQSPEVDAGSRDAGSGNAGSGNAGSRDAGSRDAGSGNAGSGNAGSGNAGSGNAGSSADAGACVSQQDEHCGGNIAHPCTCAVGLECMLSLGGPAPGDVGGTCKRSTSAGKCSTQADCRLEADYCTGCDCVALGTGQNLKPCAGPGVRCFADPCASKSVACENGSCVVH